MKKLVLSLCTLALLGVLTVTLVGCGGGSQTTKKTTTSPPSSESKEKK